MMNETKSNKISVKKPTTYVGISGGVDSSVSAHLLKEQGHNVVGVFIRGWYPPFVDCDWKQERRDAMRVCARLHIPFRELNLEKEYKREVVEYMVSEYRAGRTPNPDVMCNKYIKFGAFFDWARSEGAEYVATGHYVRTQDGKLLRGKDETKDQSYFLWTLTSDILSHTLFPVGEMEKKEVRRIAERADLFTATKHDSQGLCFIGHIDLKDFLSHYVDLTPGNVLDTDGNVIGAHDGAILYTIGQRHGFKLHTNNDEQTRMYVLDTNIQKNTITVAPHFKEQHVKKVQLSECVWREDIQEEKVYNVQFRYQQDPVPARIEGGGEDVRVVFDEKQGGIAEGQSLVVYDEDECLGGGLILSHIGVDEE